MAELTTIARPYAKTIFSHAAAAKAEGNGARFCKKLPLTLLTKR